MTRKIALLMVGFFVAAIFAVVSPPVTFGQEIKLTYANFPPAPTFPCVQMETVGQGGGKENQGKSEGANLPRRDPAACQEYF